MTPMLVRAAQKLLFRALSPTFLCGMSLFCDILLSFVVITCGCFLQADPSIRCCLTPAADGVPTLGRTRRQSTSQARIYMPTCRTSTLLLPAQQQVLQWKVSLCPVELVAVLPEKISMRFMRSVCCLMRCCTDVCLTYSDLLLHRWLRCYRTNTSALV